MTAAFVARMHDHSYDNGGLLRPRCGCTSCQEVCSLATGTPSAMQDLSERKRALSAEIKAVAKRAASAKKRAKVEARQWNLASHQYVHDVAMCIYMLTDFSLTPTTEYLKSAAGPRKWPDKDDHDIHRLIEDTFMAATDAVMLSLLDDCDDGRSDAKLEARKHAMGWCVAEWARAQNLKADDPMEPSTHDVLDQLECIRMAMPENVRPTTWGVTSEVNARKKVSRLRATYGGRVGKFKTRPLVNTCEMQPKSVAAWQWYCR